MHSVRDQIMKKNEFNDNDEIEKSNVMDVCGVSWVDGWFGYLKWFCWYANMFYFSRSVFLHLVMGNWKRNPYLFTGRHYAIAGFVSNNAAGRRWSASAPYTSMQWPLLLDCFFVRFGFQFEYGLVWFDLDLVFWFFGFLVKHIEWTNIERNFVGCCNIIRSIWIDGHFFFNLPYYE